MQYPPKIKSGIVRKNNAVPVVESHCRASWLAVSQLATVNPVPNSAENMPPINPHTAPKACAFASTRRIVSRIAALVRETRGMVRDVFTSCLSGLFCPYGKLDI
jgi:hypothetical protein